VQTMLRFGRAIAGVAFAVVVSGCVTFTPLSARRTIRGIPSTEAAVSIPASVIGRMHDVRMDMGPGICAPLVGNEKGVFFQSDRTVVVRSWLMVNPETLPGGVFVPDNPTETCKPFYYRMGMPILVEKAQNPITVILIDKRTSKKTPLKLE
jgi:hypothetical protein